MSGPIPDGDTLENGRADLHVHFEGTVTAPLFQRLAQRNNVDPRAPINLGQGRTIPGIEQWPAGPRSIAEFVSCYVKVAQTLTDPEAILDAGTDYLGRATADSTFRGAQLYFTPGTFRLLGAELEPLVDALVEIERLAERSHGMKLRWIFDIVRSLPKTSDAVIDDALMARTRGLSVLALGLAGPEREGDVSPFTAAFERARGEGFDTIAHAGEGVSVTNVLDTLRLLKPSRIGHGLSIIDDQRAVDLALERGVTIEVSPWSNILLGVSTEEAHPLLRMVDAGLDVVLASDDPGMFDRTLEDNFRLAARWGVSEERLRAMEQRSMTILSTLP